MRPSALHAMSGDPLLGLKRTFISTSKSLRPKEMPLRHIPD
jgi:hypothetical protein